MTLRSTVPVADHRDLLIDVLRGAAALAVVLHHLNAVDYYSPPAGVHTWGALTAYGYLGVPVFFVVSGYCIGQTWNRGPTAADFFRRRLRRIYPPYFASLLLILVGVAAWKVGHGINDVTPVPVTAGHWLATLTLTTDPATRYPTANWVYWSLTNEVFYYLVLGLFLLFPGPQGPRRAALVAHAGLCLLELTGRDFHGTPLFFVDHWDVFALGLGAMFVAAGRPEARWFLVISGLHLAAQAAQGRTGLYEAVGAATFAVLLLPAAAHGARGFRPLAAVGKISYSLYLLHVPVGVFLFMRLVGPHLGGSSLRFALSQLAGLALVLGAATLFYRWVERPFLRPRAIP